MSAGGTSWPSWSSSCTSSSLGWSSSLGDDDVTCVAAKPPDAAAAADAAEEEGGGGSAVVVKFLCSYDGRILPRHTDGALRYVGGDNRVLSLDRRRIRFHELVRKLSEVCGWEVRQVRCQLPAEDLDALVSVTTDADLASLLEVYDDAATATQAQQARLRPLKIRAFLFPGRTAPEPPSRSASPLPRGGGGSPSPSMASGRTASSPNLLRMQNVPWSTAGGGGSPRTCAPPWWWEQQAPAPALTAARADMLQRLQHYGRHEARPPHQRWLVDNGRHWQ